MKQTSFVFFLLILLGCARPVEQSENRVVKIIILHTNDIHGRAWPFKRLDGKRVGGYAAQAHLVSKIRKEAEKERAAFLLLSSGDVNTGVPESDFSEARPDFEAMKAISYDAMVVGNHDFDRGYELLNKQFSWAKFPFLGANIRLRKTGKPLFPGHLKIEKKGIRFGIIGVTTDELPRLILTGNSKKLIVDDSIQAAKREVSKVKDQGSDVLIALSHLGISATGLSLHRHIPNDDRKLAHSIPEIDLIIGGHSHTFLEEGLKEGKTLIAQAGYRGEFLGRVEMLWDLEGRRVLNSKAELIEVDPSQGEDPLVKSIVEPYRERYEKELGEIVFETKKPILGQRNQTNTLELPLGNLICDALRSETKTDIAFFNSGGLRSSLPEGPVKKRDVLEAFPFKNQVSTGSLKGSEVVALLNDGLRGGDFSGGVLQVSGLSYEISHGKVVRVLVGGKPISEKATYSFSTNSYVASSGDKLTTMKKAKSLRNQPQTVDEALIRYSTSRGPLEAELENRIVLKDSDRTL